MFSINRLVFHHQNTKKPENNFLEIIFFQTNEPQGCVWFGKNFLIKETFLQEIIFRENVFPFQTRDFILLTLNMHIFFDRIWFSVD